MFSKLALEPTRSKNRSSRVEKFSVKAPTQTMHADMFRKSCDDVGKLRGGLCENCVEDFFEKGLRGGLFVLASKRLSETSPF